tara:strand:- start:187 stop:399 length:213 start_codon:yes stop_codon:yes gene_type:complete
MKIVYINEEGGLSVICPSPKWTGTMQELAAKDVPTGLKYKIIEDSDVPSDRYFRNSWTVSDSDLTDGVGA